MKAEYRGYQVEVERQPAADGDLFAGRHGHRLWWAIVRLEDGALVADGSEVAAPGMSEAQKLERLRLRIDSELADPDPWGERHALLSDEAGR